MSKTVLAVGAHPDDIEFLCAGTLARYRRMGWKAAMCNVANGNRGHYRLSSARLRKIRRAEAIAAGRVIGAEVYTLDVPDGEITNDRATRLKMVGVIRRVRPDVIITHAQNDYMGDHIQASLLVCDASFLATLKLIKTGRPHLAKVPPIYFMDTVMGIGFIPTEYVDITSTIEIKKRMMACHVSQLTWLKEHDSASIVEDLATAARYRGLQCGKAYAEGFAPYHVWGRVPAERLLP